MFMPTIIKPLSKSGLISAEQMNNQLINAVFGVAGFVKFSTIRSV